MTSPGGVEAARLSVHVLPDTSGFARNLRTYLDQVESTAVLRLDAQINLPAFLSDLRHVIDAAEQAAHINLTVDLDPLPVLEEVRRVAADAERLAKITLDVDVNRAHLDAALAGTKARVPLRVDTSHLLRDVLAAVRDVERLVPPLKIRAELDQGDLIHQAVTVIDFIENGPPIKFTTELDTAGLLAHARLAADTASRSARVKFKVDLDFKAMSAALSGFATAAAGLARHAALASLVPQVIGLAGALAQVAPAALVAVPALLALAATGGAVVLAFRGVGAALAAAGNTKEFNKALKDLTPSAQAFVREAAKLIPALREFRPAMQEAFFANFDTGALTRVANNLLPTIKTELGFVADNAGFAARKVLDFLASGAARTGLADMLFDAQAMLADLGNVPTVLLRVLLSVGQAASGAFLKITGGLGGVLDRFADAVDRAAASGALTRMIGNALDVLGQLGRIAGNVGRILVALFTANSDGNGVLALIEHLSAAVANFVSSEAGQQILAKVLHLLATVGPIVAVASGLVSVIAAIGAGLAELATVAGAVLAVIGVLAAVFITAYNTINGFHRAVDATFGVFARAAQTAFGTVVGWVREQLLPAFAEMRAKVAPILDYLGDLWVRKIVPAIQKVTDAYQAQLQPTLNKVTAIIHENVMPAIDRLTAAFERNKPQIEQVVGWLASLLVASGKTGAALDGGIIRALLWLAGAVIVGVINGVTDLIGFIGAAVRAFNQARDTANRFSAAVADGTRTAVNWVSGLPGRIRGALGDLGGLLYGAGRDLVQGLINGVESMVRRAIDRVRNFASSLANAARSALGINSPSLVFAGIGEYTVDGFVQGLDRARPRAHDALSAVITPPRVPPLDARQLAPDPGGAAAAPIYVLAQIGDRPVTEMVEATVLAKPDRFAQAIRTGERSLARRG